MRALPALVHQAARAWWAVTRPVTLGVRLLLVRDVTVDRDGKVVLVEHTYQHRLYLPGGGVKRGETLEAAARREATEELGATLGALQLFGVYTNFYEAKSDHVVVFLCTDFVLGRAPAGDSGPQVQRGSREVARVLMADLHALPEATSPGSRRRINEYLAGQIVPAARTW